jgi:myosin-1
VTPARQDFLKTPAAGAAGEARKSIAQAPRPLPGGGRPKPARALPKCRTLYDYEAQDTDELAFRSGDLIEILSEG